LSIRSVVQCDWPPLVDRMLTRFEKTVDRRADVDSAAALRDRVST
jgi:hypothetical protein